MKALSVRQRAAQQAAGARWFRGLRSDQKGDLGDAFVLDTFDWRDWFERRPTSAFLQGVETERIYWECEAAS